MASSSVSQEDAAENDFEKSCRRSRIRMARGRDVRGHQPTAAVCRLGEPVAEHDDGAEADAVPRRPLDVSGYSGDHDASPKPSVRTKDKQRPVRPSHVNKGKQQRDRRKLREKRRSTGVVHMPSTEVSSTGGSTNEGDEELPAHAMSAETHRNTQQNEFTDPCVGPAADPASASFQTPQLQNKSQSDLDADDEANQEAELPGRPGPASQKLRTNGQPTAALRQLEEENHRLQQALQERDQRIAVLEATLARSRQEKQHVVQENGALIRAMEALSAQ